MRDPDGTLIRFTGVLREDHSFIHIPAWETPTVFERPDEGDGSYVVDLTDGGQRVVSRASPRIEFRDIEDPDVTGLRLADIVVYVPMHPEARELVFRRLEPSPLELFRTVLSERPPQVSDVTVERLRRTIRLRWAVSHDRPVTSTVFYVRDHHPARVLASGLVEPVLEIDSRTLPGPEGRLAVAATDGFRASAAVGPVIEGLPTDVRLEILSPEPDTSLPPDQPVPLAARAVDASGASVGLEDVTWEVDGEPAAQGRIGVAGPLAPGDHKIVASGTVGGEALKAASVRITVAPRTEDQEAWAKMMAERPPEPGGDVER
jgi:hypothetical protein